MCRHRGDQTGYSRWPLRRVRNGSRSGGSRHLCRLGSRPRHRRCGPRRRLELCQDVTGSTSRRGTGATGAAAAPPAGVGASGVDVPYPRRQTRLWEQVAQIGVILSETPPGRPAQAWRFPARNRIIAALSQMVVVVESHQAGGSLITAEAAIYRGIDVRAVPGPVRSPASAGSNQLLHDGPAPVRNAQDVLDGLGIFLPGPERRAKGASAAGRRVGRVPLDPEVRRVLDAVLWRPCSFNHILANSKVPVSAVARALDWLEAEGWVSRHGDWWVRHAGGERDKREAIVVSRRATAVSGVQAVGPHQAARSLGPGAARRGRARVGPSRSGVSRRPASVPSAPGTCDLR